MLDGILRLCLFWRSYIVVSPIYRLPVNDTGSAEPVPPTVTAQLQITDSSFVVCWESVLQRMYKVSLHLLDGKEISTAEVEGTCYLFQDFPTENCCRVQIGYSGVHANTATVSLQIEIIDKPVQLSQQSLGELIFTNGTALMKLYDVDDYAVLSEPKVTLEECSAFVNTDRRQSVFYTDARISINATQPVAVIAHDYLSNTAGDSSTLLPTNMAGTSYTFSLPAPAASGISIAYLLPVDNSVTRVNITAIYEFGGKTNAVSEELNLVGKQRTLYAYQSEEAVSLLIQSDLPILVVAAVQRLSNSNSNMPKTNFDCFMPAPLLDTGKKLFQAPFVMRHGKKS
ncbi:unnamed protein product [Gongylonema pulchrum]|uniref:Fibronectin type-III domain-containing protein n=1 Tax=Gongylonema pulchrum TaxID=637853 RepID=A0A183DSX1_9BILA|nr:unnamed protein product [Gongylonema pulchrum]